MVEDGLESNSRDQSWKSEQRKKEKTHLRIRFGNLHEDSSEVSSFSLSRETEEELGNERNPVPSRNFSLVILESFRNRFVRIVETEEPEYSYEHLANLGVLVESSGLKVTTDSVCGDREFRRILLEHSILIFSPFCPCFSECHIHRDGEVESLVRFVMKMKFGEEHSLESEEFSFLRTVEIHQVRVVDNLES